MEEGRREKKERNGRERRREGRKEERKSERVNFHKVRPGEMEEITIAEPLSFLFNLSLDVLLVNSLQRPFIFKIERLGRVIMRYYV